jgi:hypothetical protein
MGSVPVMGCVIGDDGLVGWRWRWQLLLLVIE